MKPLGALLFFVSLASAQTPASDALPSKPGLYAMFNTSEGSITARLYEKDTPIAVQNFVALAEGAKAWRDPKTGAMVKRPIYDNITFHRIIPGEVIQSGDPTGTGFHNCGVTIHDEFLPGLRFSRPGRLAVANNAIPIQVDASSSSLTMSFRDGTASTRSSVKSSPARRSFRGSAARLLTAKSRWTRPS